LQFLNQSFSGNSDFLEENRDKNQDNQERILDEFAYKLTLYLLFEGNESRPLDFLKVFEEEFNKNASKYCPDMGATINQYKDDINTIRKVIQGTRPKTSFAKNRHTLDAIMYLCLAYDIDKFDALNSKLQSFELSADLRRIIWSFFGMLHGISPLGREFKNDKICSYLSNIIVHRNLKYSEIPNRLLSLQSLNRQIVEHESFKSMQEHIIFSEGKIPFPIIISDVEEPIRKQLLTMINNGQTEQVQKVLFEFFKVPNEYIKWTTVHNGDIDIEYRGTKHTIYSKEEPVKNKIFDEKMWDVFRQGFLEDKASFKKFLLEKESIPKINASLNQLQEKEIKTNILKKDDYKDFPKNNPRNYNRKRQNNSM
jgi:hypothetical protein